ncbi:MAG: DUF4157 domain-containing protein [Chitinophagaceae bacterium]
MHTHQQNTGVNITPAKRTAFFQAKLSVNQPNDVYEQEADRVAEKVVQAKTDDVFFAPKPLAITPVQRKCAACEEEEKKGVQRKCKDCEEKDKKAQRKEASDNAVSNTSSLDNYVSSISGSGQSLSNEVRNYYEPRIGYDFGNVRVHTDTQAAKSAQSINALAYTTGNNIVFNSGQYAPETSSGKKLLAHELTHVVQQGNVHTNGVSRSVIQRRVISEDFATAVFLPGPLWDVHLVITHAPDADTEQLDDFIDACHSGVQNAATSMGQNPGVRRNRFSIRMRFRRRFDYGDVSHEAYTQAIASVRPTTPAVPADTRTDAQPHASSPARTPPLSASVEQPAPGETREQRIQRQWRTTMSVLSRVVADADREGYGRVILNIENNGQEIIPGFAKEEPSASRSSGRVSAETVRQTLSTFTDTVTERAGNWEIVYVRDTRDGMIFNRFSHVVVPTPGSAAISEAEEMRRLGIPDRRQIYGQIFQQAERELRAAGIMIAGFTIEQLVLWVAGGVLFRALGLLGRGALSAFPKISALLARGNTTVFARGLEALAGVEREEFALLMQRVETGTITAAEQTRLTGFLARVEAALPVALRSSTRSIIQLAEQAGVRAEIETGRIAVVLHGTTETVATSMVENIGASLSTSGGNFGGRLFTATDFRVIDEFAARTVTRQGGQQGIVGIAMSEETMAVLRQRGMVRSGLPIADRPGMYETIFEPGAIEILNREGFFFIVY